MTMRLNPTYQNHMKDWVKGSIIMYMILVAVYLVALIVTLLNPGLEETPFDGIEAVSGIFMLVAGIASFKPNLKLALANGISRKTEFVSAMLSAATLSVIFLAANSIIGLLFGTISDYQSEFQAMYGKFDFINSGVYGLTAAVYSIISNFGGYVAGYFIGGLYYRMPKSLKIAVSVGVPVLAFIGLPIGSIFAYKSEFIRLLITHVVTFVAKIVVNPYLTLLASVVFVAAFLVFSFLLIRRAPIQEQG